MDCYGDGYCFRKNGWIYLLMEGNPYERGLQHGYLTARDMARALKTIKYYVYFTTGMDFQFFTANANRRWKSFLKKSSEFKEEIRGIVDGAQKAGISISFEELIGWNGFMGVRNSGSGLTI